MTISRRRKDSVFERAQCALFIVNEQGQVLQANRRAVELTGFPRRELEETGITAVLQPVEWEEVWSQLLAIGTLSHRLRLNGAMSSRRGAPIQVEVFVRLYQTARTPRSALVRARDTREESLLRDRLRERIRRASASHERDRKRIARALHDSTIHDLLTTMTTLDSAIETTANTQVEPQLRQVRQELDGLLESVRNLVGHLRADELETGGLVSGLEALLQDARSTGMRTHLVAPSHIGQMNKHARLLVYRVAQEAVRNAIRHSHATDLHVLVECDDEWLTLSVSDNGIGFSAPSSEAEAATAAALGLQGAFERASLLGGILTIDSTPTTGSQIRLTVPLSVVCERPPDSASH